MKTDVVDVPENPESYEFTVGQWYRRGGLHDAYKGNRQKGISSPADHPIVFVFTGDPGEEFGYEDEFREDGTLVYTGVGRTGDQEMAGMNERLKNHREYGDAVHVFEEVRETPTSVVSYVGEYEVEKVEPRELEDENGQYRRAFQFELVPVGGSETTVEVDEGDSPEELFHAAKQSTSQSSSTTTSMGSSGGSNHSRSEPVRQFALADADGVCQGCEEEAPFETPAGRPYLEVHHLYRLSDGGLDDPENVIALCPNCHRRRHEGKDGDEFNQKLIEKAEERNRRIRAQ